MMVKQPPSYTREERTLFELHQALQGNTEPPSLADYATLGEWHDIAVEMYTARIERGIDGVKAYVSSLQKIKTERYRRLVKLLSGYTLGEEHETPVYHGTLLSEVKAEKVKWLWKHRLALGKITMLDGDPGLGKSLIGADLGARITKGQDMPDGTPCLAPGGMVIIMPEDGLGDTIRPRFERAGANLNKISSIGTIRGTDDEGNPYERPFLLSRDLPILEAEIERVGATFVYIDPIMAILGSTKDTYKDNEVRDVLFPLKALVEKHMVSCVLVRHLTKARGDNPLLAGNGSIAFIGLARTGLMVVRDPEDDSQVILSHIKSNIGPIAPGLLYKVHSDDEQGDDRPYIVWGDTTRLTGSDLMTIPRRNIGGNRQEILNLLQEHAPNPLTVKEIADELPEMTINNLKITLKRMYDNGEIGKSERGSYHAK